MRPIVTRSDCPTCGQTVPATLVERGGDVVMRKECPTHGAAESLFARDAAFFEKNLGLSSAGRLPDGPLALADGAADGFLTTFAIDVTTRCNLSCPTCFAVGGSDAPDPSVDELLSWIPDCSRRRGFRPNISLVGGESTLRDDLPEIVRGIIRKGLVPRLNSNGLLLRDPARLSALWDAGLRWVILQFDGFSPDASVAFRGRDLTAEKRETIAALTAKGMSMHLAVMVQRGVNDGELGDILRFAAAQPRILRVSFYPRSDVGRFAAAQAAPTHVADVLAALARTTDDQITPDDVLDAKRLWRALFRLTGRPVFRTRPCIFPFVVLRRGDRFLPLTRLLRPSHVLADPGALWRVLRAAPRLLRPDDATFSSDFLFVNIEKFYDRAALDFDQVQNCHHIYLTADGAVPFCVHNLKQRAPSPTAGESPPVDPRR